MVLTVNCFLILFPMAIKAKNQVAFTLEDRDRIIRLEEKVGSLEKKSDRCEYICVEITIHLFRFHIRNEIVFHLNWIFLQKK